MKKLIQKINRWLYKTPNQNDLVGVNIRETVQTLLHHVCMWEYRMVDGEEEHGLNRYQRFCKICDKCQQAQYHRFGDVRITWNDRRKPTDIKLNRQS